MSEETVQKAHLNPITFEAYRFLRALRRCSPNVKILDEELLNVMDNLVEAIQEFHNQCTTKIEETENLRLVKSKELQHIQCNYICERCHKQLGTSISKIVQHITEGFCPRPIITLPPESKKKNQNSKKENRDPKKETEIKGPREVFLTRRTRSLLQKNNIKRCGKKTDVKVNPGLATVENDLLDILRTLFPHQNIKCHRLIDANFFKTVEKPTDMDFYFEIDANFQIFENEVSAKTLKTMEDVCVAFNNNSKWKKVESFLYTHGPLIRLTHNLTLLTCKVRILNGLILCNNLLIQYYFDLQPLARELCIILMTWLRRTSLNEIIPTYSVTLMIIYFLQVNNALTSLKQLQIELEHKILVGPWISNFPILTLKECSLKPLNISIKNLLNSFFKFIVNFDFENYVICPHLGVPVKKEELKEKLPKTYNDYVLEKGKQAELDLEKPCIIQDPIQLNRNIAEDISLYQLETFQAFCKESAKLIDPNWEPNNCNTTRLTEDHDLSTESARSINRSWYPNIKAFKSSIVNQHFSQESATTLDPIKDLIKDHDFCTEAAKSLNRNWKPEMSACKGFTENQRSVKALDPLWNSLKDNDICIEAAKSLNRNWTPEMSSFKGLTEDQDFSKESAKTLNLNKEHDFYTQTTKSVDKNQHPDENITINLIKDFYVDSNSDADIPVYTIVTEDKWMKRAYTKILKKSVEKFFTYNSKNQADLERTSVDRKINQDLLSILKPLFPNERINFYRTSPLMCPFKEKKRGIDIFVDIGNRSEIYENSPSASTLRAITDIKSTLNGAKWTKVNVVENVPIPYIKAKHPGTHILCNISVSNNFAFRNAKLIQYFFILQPIVLRLNNYLEKWLRVTQLTSTIHPYCMTLMIIYFFQLNNFLPSVEKLQENLQNKELVGPWLVNFMELSSKDCGIKKIIECKPYIMQQYLSEIFEFLGKFDYENFIICPYFGTIIRKTTILSKLPERYFSYIHNHGSGICLKYKTPCVVVDPIQLNYNISANIGISEFQRFKNLQKSSD